MLVAGLTLVKIINTIDTEGGCCLYENPVAGKTCQIGLEQRGGE